MQRFGSEIGASLYSNQSTPGVISNSKMQGPMQPRINPWCFQNGAGDGIVNQLDSKHPSLFRSEDRRTIWSAAWDHHLPKHFPKPRGYKAIQQIVDGATQSSCTAKWKIWKNEQTEYNKGCNLLAQDQEARAAHSGAPMPVKCVVQLNGLRSSRHTFNIGKAWRSTVCCWWGMLCSYSTAQHFAVSIQ